MILTMFEVHGESPEEMVAKADGAMGHDATKIAGEHGGLSNTIVKTEEGVLIINLWESEEGMESFAGTMRPRIEEAGVGQQIGWQMYEVLQHRTPGN